MHILSSYYYLLPGHLSSLDNALTLVSFSFNCPSFAFNWTSLSLIFKRVNTQDTGVSQDLKKKKGFKVALVNTLARRPFRQHVISYTQLFLGHFFLSLKYQYYGFIGLTHQHAKLRHDEVAISGMRPANFQTHDGWCTVRPRRTLNRRCWPQTIRRLEVLLVAPQRDSLPHRWFRNGRGYPVGSPAAAVANTDRPMKHAENVDPPLRHWLCCQTSLRSA